MMAMTSSETITATYLSALQAIGLTPDHAVYARETPEELWSPGRVRNIASLPIEELEEMVKNNVVKVKIQRKGESGGVK